jgi:hypothetical protein
MQVLVDSAPGLGRKGGTGRSYADAPEIDGVVKSAAARENQQDAQGRGISRGADRGHARAMTWWRCRSENDRPKQKKAACRAAASIQQTIYIWCPGRDSNPHDVTR